MLLSELTEKETLEDADKLYIVDMTTGSQAVTWKTVKEQATPLLLALTPKTGFNDTDLFYLMDEDGNPYSVDFDTLRKRIYPDVVTNTDGDETVTIVLGQPST